MVIHSPGPQARCVLRVRRVPSPDTTHLHLQPTPMSPSSCLNNSPTDNFQMLKQKDHLWEQMEGICKKAAGGLGWAGVSGHCERVVIYGSLVTMSQQAFHLVAACSHTPLTHSLTSGWCTQWPTEGHKRTASPAGWLAPCIGDGSGTCG